MKNKKMCFVSTHVKLFYDNGILNLKTLITRHFVLILAARPVW